jgi:Predicted membrane protein
MDRGEFLSILRESMEGLIPMDEVEKNIQFYRSYFDESGQADREVIEELGDPRLIARTIIDAYKASKGPMADYYTEQARSEYSREHSGQYGDFANQEGGGGSGRRFAWLEKAIGWFVVLFVAIVFFVVAVAVVGVFVGYVLPVILLIVLIKILADYFRR